MDESESYFTKMADDLVEYSQFDTELADGIRWIDVLARKKGISFYDQLYEILYTHEINEKARRWMNEK